MSTPTIRDLVASLGEHLQPAAGFSSPSTPVSAVHISELPEPTGYLTGGELLLTTGLALSSDVAACQAYIEDLEKTRIAAIGFGLGPVHDHVPGILADACRSAGVTLLVVPEATPFITISRAYWTAVARSGEQALIDQLSAQRALVDAASSPDPTRDVVRTLAKWLDGWVALYAPDGDLEQVWPAKYALEATRMRRHIHRLAESGRPAAGSVISRNRRIAIFPLTAGSTENGYLAAASPRELDASARRTILAGVALLGLSASRGVAAQVSTETAAGAIATLLEAGHSDAAARISLAYGIQAPGPVVRVVAVAGVPAARRAAARLAPEAPRWSESDTLSWFVLPASVDRIAERIQRADPAAKLAISDLVALGDVGLVKERLVTRLARLGTGEVDSPSPAPQLTEIESACTQLAQRPRLELTTREYLRHHGNREASARALGIHRNTLRHRIEKVADLIGLDLDDPDVRAHLWLALRTSHGAR